jgi:hypothetical protein
MKSTRLIAIVSVVGITSLGGGCSEDNPAGAGGGAASDGGSDASGGSGGSPGAGGSGGGEDCRETPNCGGCGNLPAACGGIPSPDELCFCNGDEEKLSSADLIGAWIGCACRNCAEACTPLCNQTGPPDATCRECTEGEGDGACVAEWDACLADVILECAG